MSTKDEIYRKIDELTTTVDQDMYYLTRTQQDAIKLRIQQLREFIIECHSMHSEIELR